MKAIAFGGALMALLLSVMAGASGNSPAMEREPNPKKAGVGTLLKNMAKGPFQVRAERKQADKLGRAWPDDSVSLVVPDSALIYSWIEALCQTPHRRPGTPGDLQAENWIADRFREFGLENVTLDPIPLQVWTAEQWSLAAGAEKIPGFFIVNTGFTGPAGVTAPLVYVGAGRPRDYDRAEVKGKIVVVDMPILRLPTGALLKLSRSYYALSDPQHELTFGYGQYLTFVNRNFMGYAAQEKAPADDIYWQAYRQGAAAICIILQGYPANVNSHYGPYDGVMKPLPGLWIGNDDGKRLRELARQGAPATLVLNGRIEPGVTHNVWGQLPGASDEVILVTSHHDSSFLGAVEDGAGAAQVLAQAWTWSRLPKEQRPKTFVFVVDAGHFYGSIGAQTFAREHQDLIRRARVVFTLEHLGAKDVEERDREYADTGRPALTILFTSHDPKLIAAVRKGLKREPLPATVAVPVDLLGPSPPTDASGYLAAGVPGISWITGPTYLLDEHDTLDKIEKKNLQPIARTVAEMIGGLMAMK